MSREDLSFIHRFEPAREPGEHRTLLMLHGTGGSENDLVPLGHALDRSAAILSPRGKVLEKGMPRFFRRLAEGVFDEEDVKRRANELADFVEEAAEVYGFSRGGVVAAGYSNGANIAAAMLLLRPEVLCAAILFRPMVPLVPEQMPDLSGTHVFISEGRYDPMGTPEQTQRLFTLLRDAGALVTLHVEDLGHEIGGGDLREAAGWLSHLQVCPA